MTLRENEVILQYLRNITSKMSTLFERIDALEAKVIALGTAVMALGNACGTAFTQCKEVVNKLAEATEETRMDLAEYGGVIEAESFFNGC